MLLLLHVAGVRERNKHDAQLGIPVEQGLLCRRKLHSPQRRSYSEVLLEGPQRSRSWWSCEVAPKLADRVDNFLKAWSRRVQRHMPPIKEVLRRPPG